MPMQVTPLHPVFAAEITGLDLSLPIEALPMSVVRDAMDRYAVCIVRNDHPSTDEQHIAFSDVTHRRDMRRTTCRGRPAVVPA